MSTTRPRTARRLAVAGVVFASLTPVGVAAASSEHEEPRLTGRAVLAATTEAEGPPSGLLATPANGITFPRAMQPVIGFSAIVEGRRPGEWLAMPDNGYGGKAISGDFHIRAYYLRPDFKTAAGGSGDVEVGPFIEFTDPDHHLDFPLAKDTPERVLTGKDIDPESLQRAHDGTLWVGDEFGPWILHFDAEGRLLEPPHEIPGLQSPNNPHLGTATATVPNSGGFEAMGMSPNGRYLYPVLERALVADAAAPFTRRVYEFDTRTGAFTHVATYLTEVAGHFVADAQMLDPHRMLLIERDGGSGATALQRKVYEVDLRDVTADGTLTTKTEVVDLAKIPDPDGVTQPEPGVIGLGDPYRVTCESIEALRIINHRNLLLGCDNNFPNAGRVPGVADDSEFITVRIP